MATVGRGGGRSGTRFRSRAIAAARPRCRAVAADGSTGNHARGGAGATSQSCHARGDRGEDRKSPCDSRRSGVSHGTGQRDRPEIRGRHGDDDACDRSRATTACGAGDGGASFGGRGGRSSSTDTGTGTDNGIGRGIGSSSESCKRQRGATRRHGPCSESRDSLRRGRHRRRGRRTARVPCSRSGRGHLPPGIAPRLGADGGVTKASVGLYRNDISPAAPAPRSWGHG